MRYGIPAYRLARAVLDGEIARIVATGINVRCGAALGDAEDFERLRAEYDAVYLALGARPETPAATRLHPALGARGRRLSGARQFGTPPVLGRRLVVIGGGSAALDAARSARRAGHEVTILALEGARPMPAQREEVVEAREEGIAARRTMLRGGAKPGGAACALNCVQVPFGPGAQRGQFTVTPVEAVIFRWRRRHRQLDRPGPRPGAARPCSSRRRAAADRCATAPPAPRRVCRRRHGQHGALRDRGDRHGPTRGAGHRPPLRRNAPPAPSPRKHWSSLDAHQPSTTRSRVARPSNA